MKSISLSVRDFAVPVPRVGSIETHSGYGNSAEEGQAIHIEIQSQRVLEDPNYRSEVKISRKIQHQDFEFEITGRIDGLFVGESPKIEEIKSSFNIWELHEKLSNPSTDHPYTLQLKTYGYLYALENQVNPELSFLLVSSRNREKMELKVKFSPPEFEKWLIRRLDQLVLEVKTLEKREKRRIKIASDFKFPFENPRPHQKELIQTIENGMKENVRMMVQAPTGLGKTAGVLYPALKEALSRGQNVIYVTPKNSQHSVAEDAVQRFQNVGSKVKSLTITAKSKICFKGEPVCHPKYCEYAKDHYTKVSENNLLDLIARKKKLNAKVFEKIGEEYQVCPFELQLSSVPEADVVICDYNYVFSPKSSLDRAGPTIQLGNTKSNLVIDEAHNLPSRTMEYYSSSLSSFAFEKMRKDVEELPKTVQKEALKLISECMATIASCKPEGSGENLGTFQSMKIHPPLEPFLEMDSRLRAFLSRYLEKDLEIQPRDVVFRLCYYWSEFTAALNLIQDRKRSEFFTTYQDHPSGGTIQIVCCDASEMSKDVYDRYQQVVAFSATLKPFDYYAKLSGLQTSALKTAEFQSPFSPTHRKLLIIPQVSTKYFQRQENYPKIAEAIQRISAVKPGNYFAFFPSFDFMERVYQLFQPPPEFRVLKQEREMKMTKIEEVLDHLRTSEVPTLVFAVQGGVFSEGVDYPGDMMIGAFIVGPPLPGFNLEREEMKKYYEEKYGLGFDYAYTFPAMAKAVQAAGRVIRSETDRGVIILMDQRFIQKNYTQSMPADWFNSQVTELVSKQILKEVTEFWASSE